MNIKCSNNLVKSIDEKNKKISFYIGGRERQSSIDMYNNDGGKKFMKQTGALKAATLYFAS